VVEGEDGEWGFPVDGEEGGRLWCGAFSIDVAGDGIGEAAGEAGFLGRVEVFRKAEVDGGNEEGVGDAGGGGGLCGAEVGPWGIDGAGVVRAEVGELDDEEGQLGIVEVFTPALDEFGEIFLIGVSVVDAAFALIEDDAFEADAFEGGDHGLEDFAVVGHPWLDGCVAAGGLDEADGDVVFLLEVVSETPAEAGEGSGIAGGAGGPGGWEEGGAGRFFEVEEAWGVRGGGEELGDAVGGVDEGEFHIGLASAEPDIADPEVADFGCGVRRGGAQVIGTSGGESGEGDRP